MCDTRKWDAIGRGLVAFAVALAFVGVVFATAWLEIERLKHRPAAEAKP